MADLKTVVSQYQELSKEWSKAQSRDLSKIGNLLEKLKLSLTQLSFLPTKGEEASVQVRYLDFDTVISDSNRYLWPLGNFSSEECFNCSVF